MYIKNYITTQLSTYSDFLCNLTLMQLVGRESSLAEYMVNYWAHSDQLH